MSAVERRARCRRDALLRSLLAEEMAESRRRARRLRGVRIVAAAILRRWNTDARHREYARGYDDGKALENPDEALRRDRDLARRELQRMTELIRRFEGVTGIAFDSWADSPAEAARVGNAVNAVLLGDDRLDRAAQSLANAEADLERAAEGLAATRRRMARAREVNE